MKPNILTTTVMLLACSLFIFGYFSFKSSLATNAIESRIDHFLRQGSPSLSKSDESLAHMESSLFVFSAHQLNSFILFNQWRSYLNQVDNPNPDWFTLLGTSAHIRPTWSNTYVELAKLTSSLQEELAYQQLALLFGPYSLSSRLLLIDSTFSRWEEIAVEQRVDASQHLISIANSWRHRPKLNSMITLSEGSQRICNLLVFNEIKVKACG
ncbi:hypothetical protein [Enterovibrio calviensis]|uniref:hypothetical protein n=1 Tax=Enterovibrio calviensis TaxID=91359 RepID=UPI000489AC85|nr:hypothetical protein [Enterovibrio calviensis]